MKQWYNPAMDNILETLACVSVGFALGTVTCALSLYVFH